MTTFDPRFVPRWARSEPDADTYSDIPNTGTEPALAPRLPTRLLPFDGSHVISAITLKDVMEITQRILNCVSYEVVYGLSSDAIDLRRVDPNVMTLARLDVEPFEEGSFVVPGALTEEEIDFEFGKFSGADVLNRFSTILSSIKSIGKAPPTSVTILQAFEALGRVTRREADIEYQPSYGYGTENFRESYVVDNGFVELIGEIRKRQVDPSGEYGEIEGTLVGINIRQATMQLAIAPRTVIRGTFGEFARQVLVSAVGKRIRVSGVITSEQDEIKRVLVVLAEVIE